MPNPEPLKHGQYYHVWNRGINGQPVFLQERNYDYFLNLYAKHVVPVVDTFAYCLLNNHFHLAIRVKTIQELTGAEDISGQVLTPRKPSQYISNWINAYTRGVNNAVGRTGALFDNPFDRKRVDSKAYLLRLIAYINQNPQKHGFVEDFREWKYSSYWVLSQ